MKRRLRALSFMVAVLAVLIAPAAAKRCAAADVTAPGEPGERFQGNLDYAQVVFVKAVEGDDGRWCISATLRHKDEGWEHYAVMWEALDPDGGDVAWRGLAHPHVYEQPFERDKCEVVVPAGVTTLRVRAKCNVHGFGGQEVFVDLTVAEGERFTVSRR